MLDGIIHGTTKPEGKINMSDETSQPAPELRHIPPVANLLKFFAFDHLPPKLAAVSGSFCNLAHEMAVNLPDNPEKTVALRKLLEAKDCAVRAVL